MRSIPSYTLLLTLLAIHAKCQDTANNEASAYDASSSVNNYNWLAPATGFASDVSASATDLEQSPSYDVDAEGSYRKRLRKKNRNGSRKKGKKRQKTRVKEYEYYEDDEDYYYDRDDGYSPPSSGYNAPSYNAPAPSYSAPSYEAPSYSAPSTSYGAPSYGGGGGDGFNDFLNALAAFLPIGLFLAAIPPNLITINTGKKKRSLDELENQVEEAVSAAYSYPYLDKISQMGFDQFMSNLNCQKQLFCEMSLRGLEGDANMVQKVFHQLAAYSPQVVSDILGSTDVFRAAREGNCSHFKCK